MLIQVRPCPRRMRTEPVGVPSNAPPCSTGPPGCTAGRSFPAGSPPRKSAPAAGLPRPVRGIVQELFILCKDKCSSAGNAQQYCSPWIARTRHTGMQSYVCIHERDGQRTCCKARPSLCACTLGYSRGPSGSWLTAQSLTSSMPRPCPSTSPAINRSASNAACGHRSKVSRTVSRQRHGTWQWRLCGLACVAEVGMTAEAPELSRSHACSRSTSEPRSRSTLFSTCCPRAPRTEVLVTFASLRPLCQSPILQQ